MLPGVDRRGQRPHHLGVARGDVEALALVGQEVVEPDRQALIAEIELPSPLADRVAGVTHGAEEDRVMAADAQTLPLVATVARLKGSQRPSIVSSQPITWPWVAPTCLRS